MLLFLAIAVTYCGGICWIYTTETVVLKESLLDLQLPTKSKENV